MVKGTSKRVVVVKSPDSRVFEQAIFIVREDYLSKWRGEGRGDILREAQLVADQYIRAAVLPGDRGLWFRLPLWARIAGVALALAGLSFLGLRLWGIL